MSIRDNSKKFTEILDGKVTSSGLTTNTITTTLNLNSYTQNSYINYTNSSIALTNHPSSVPENITTGCIVLFDTDGINFYQRLQYDNTTYYRSGLLANISSTLWNSTASTTSGNEATNLLLGQAKTNFVPFIDIEIEQYFANHHTVELLSDNYMNDTNSARIRFDFRDANLNIIPTTYRYQGAYYADNLTTYGNSVSSSSAFGILTDINYAVTFNRTCFVNAKIQKIIEGSLVYYNIRSQTDYFSTSNTNTTFINSTNARLNSTQVLKYIRIYASTGNIKGTFELFGYKKGTKVLAIYEVEDAEIAEEAEDAEIAEEAEDTNYTLTTNN